MFKDLFPIDWQTFHFLRPEGFWLFAPFCFIFILGLFALRQDIKWKKIIAPHLRPFVIQKGSEWTRFLMHLTLFVGLSCGILALAGPTWKKIKVPGQKLETPVVILLDLSQSMMAEDLQPNRLERAKFKINDLLKKNPRARVALVAFAGTAHTVVPLSSDYKIIYSHIEGMKSSIMPYPGSDLEAAFIMADTLMSVTKAPGTVVVFSDDFTEAHFEVVKRFTEKPGKKVEIVPMNTEMGSEVPNFWGKQSMKDADGHPVYSSLNQSAIKKLASLEAVSVHPLTLDDSDIEAISKKIAANLTFQEKDKEKKDDWRDAGLLLVIPMAVLLLLWFRKGWVIYAAILFSSCSGNLSFSDLWFTKDYQGQLLSKKQKYAQAAETFQDPMRKGVAYFKDGNFDQAILAFNQDTTALGRYNLGLAYFKSGDTLAAQLAFGIAAEMDPTLEAAEQNQQFLSKIRGEDGTMDPEKAQEAKKLDKDKNVQNKDMENLGGGGQEASKKDMEKQRKEEIVNSNIRKAKELDEVPKDLEVTIQNNPRSNVLLRKIDDDPALFLKKKFEYQVKKQHIKPKPNAPKW